MDHLSWFSMQIHCVIFVNFSPFCYCRHRRRWCCSCCWCWCCCSIQFDFHRRNIYLFLLFGLFIDRKSLILTYVYMHIAQCTHSLHAYVRTSYIVCIPRDGWMYNCICIRRFGCIHYLAIAFLIILLQGFHARIRSPYQMHRGKGLLNKIKHAAPPPQKRALNSEQSRQEWICVRKLNTKKVE